MIGIGPMHSLLLASRAERLSVLQFELTHHYGAVSSQCCARPIRSSRASRPIADMRFVFNIATFWRTRFAVVIGIFFTVDWCHVRWIFIKVRSAYSEILAVRVYPVPQFFT